MSLSFISTDLSSIAEEDSLFYSVVDRLKAQSALPDHCFLKDLPFFNIPSLSKETQVRELFESCCDVELCNQLLRIIAPLPEGEQYQLVPQNFAKVSVMSFAQIVLYKVLPCPDANCPNCPREIATHNQYKDFEYQCPFYHHERDRRRLVIADSVDEEFVYKANYFEEGRRRGDKEKYSQNYFESMFHPLYYKMFRCKRDFCNQCVSCPFFHSEEERKRWDNTFSSFIKKDRVSYVKEKQNSAEKKPRVQGNRQKSSEDEEYGTRDNYGYVNKRGNTKQYKNNYNRNYQTFNNQVYTEDCAGKMPVKAWSDWKVDVNTYRKDSDSSFEEKYGSGFFAKLQQTPSGYNVY